MAFLHHLAAFSVVGALAAEVVLFKLPLTVVQARRVQRADQVFGAAATVLLVVGLLRVFYFEKGAGYYFANGFFLTKFTLFILAALISIYPTVLFISWNKTLKQGEAPAITAQAATRARMCMMLELTAILGILLCAPFMARGIG
jgi:putative membrane protein